MKNIKTILIAVLSFMLLFSVSCKNEDKTGGVGDVVQGYTHSNHPPEGKYMRVRSTSGWTNTNIIATVKIVDGNCNITGKVYPYTTGIGLDYDITVTSWYTYPDTSYLNRAGNLVENSGEATITKPASSTLDYFNVEYNTTNESISVSFRTTQDIKYYSTLDLKKVN